MSNQIENPDFLRLDDDKIAEFHANFCAIFAVGNRLRIMWFLGLDERNVGEIARYVGITTQNVSQHLRMMRDRGAVVSRREGNVVYYRVSNPKFLEGARLIREGLIEVLDQMSDIK